MVDEASSPPVQQQINPHLTDVPLSLMKMALALLDREDRPSLAAGHLAKAIASRAAESATA
jgi:hypothetical protein